MVKNVDFFSERFYKYDGSWHTAFWKQPTYLTKISTVLCCYVIPWWWSLADRNMWQLLSMLLYS